MVQKHILTLITHLNEQTTDKQTDEQPEKVTNKYNLLAWEVGISAKTNIIILLLNPSLV